MGCDKMPAELPQFIRKRGSSYQVQIRRKGEEPIAKTFRTLAEAENFVKSQTSGHTSSSVKLSDVIDAYRQMKARTARAVKEKSNEDYMLQHLDRDLGDLQVAKLTPDRMRQWAEMRSGEGAGSYTISMELTKLGTVVRMASVSLGISLPDVATEARPLLKHLSLIGGTVERDRICSVDEERRLLAVSPPWMADLIRFAIATAMRRSEISAARFSHVNHKQRLLLLPSRKHPRKKSGHDQWVPLLNGAYEIIVKQEQDGDRIFPYSREKISDTFKLIREMAGIDNMVFHDLRHTAVTRLFEQGYSIEQVALVSGHLDWRHLRRYTNLRPEMLHSFTPPRPAIAPDQGKKPNRKRQPTAPNRSKSSA